MIPGDGTTPESIAAGQKDAAEADDEEEQQAEGIGKEKPVKKSTNPEGVIKEESEGAGGDAVEGAATPAEESESGKEAGAAEASAKDGAELPQSNEPKIAPNNKVRVQMPCDACRALTALLNVI